MRKEGLCVSTPLHSRSNLSGVPRVVSSRSASCTIPISHAKLDRVHAYPLAMTEQALHLKIGYAVVHRLELRMNSKNGAHHFRGFANYLIFVDCTSSFHLISHTAIVRVSRDEYELRWLARYSSSSHGLFAQSPSAECKG